MPEGDDWVIFGVTPEEYEDLAFNQAEYERWIFEAMWRLLYYRGELKDGTGADGPRAVDPD